MIIKFSWVKFWGMVMLGGVSLLGGQRTAWAADRETLDHLVPAETRGGLTKQLRVTESEMGWMMVVPGLAFSGISALAVHGDASAEVLKRHDDKKQEVPLAEKRFFLTRTELTRESGKEVTMRHDLEISAELAIAIQKAWTAMLIEARKPDKGVMMLVDGTTYEFGVQASGKGFLTAEAWYPAAGPLEAMIQLGSELKALAKLKKPLTHEQEVDLIQRLGKVKGGNG